MGKKLKNADWAIDMARSVAKRIINIYNSPALPILKNMLGLKEIGLPEKGKQVEKEISWTPEAKMQLSKLPIFVRPMAKRAIENEAKERGVTAITIDLMLEVKEKMGR